MKRKQIRNKEKARIQNIQYLNTESGFLISKWGDIHKRIRRIQQRKQGKLQDLKLETRKKYPAVFSSQNYPVILDE